MLRRMPLTIASLPLSLVLTWAPLAAAGGMLDSLKDTFKGALKDVQDEAAKRTKDKAVETMPGAKESQSQTAPGSPDPTAPGTTPTQSQPVATPQEKQGGLPKKVARPPGVNTNCVNTRGSRQDGEARLAKARADHPNPTDGQRSVMEGLERHTENMRALEQRYCGAVENTQGPAPSTPNVTAPSPTQKSNPKGVCVGVRCDSMRMNPKCKRQPGDDNAAYAARMKECMWGPGSGMTGAN